MKLYLNFSEYAIFDADSSANWEDFSLALLDKGFTRKQCVGAQGKAEQQTVAMTLMSISGATNLALRILSSSHPVRARLLNNDNSAYFTGSIRPMANLSASSYLEPISVSILDDSEYLDYAVVEQKSTLNLELKVAGTTASNSLVHWIISQVLAKQSSSAWGRAIPDAKVVIEAGLPVANLTASAVTMELGASVKDTLDSVLYEYGLQYRFDEAGNIHIINAAPGTTGATVISDSGILNSMTVKRSDQARKGARVIYYKTVKKVCTVAKHSIYDNEYNDDKTLGRGYEWLTSGEQWPPSAYQVKTIEARDLEDSGYEIIKYDLSTMGLEIGSASEKNSFTKTLTQESAVEGKYRYRFYVTGGSNKDLIKSLSLTCQCWCLDKNDPKEESSLWLKNPTKYTCKHIHTSQLAKNLANIISMRNGSGGIKYSFKVAHDSTLAPGQVIRIQSVTTGIDTYARILSVSDAGPSKASPLKSVECEGIETLADIGDLSIESVAKFISTNGGVSYLKLVPSKTSVDYRAVGDGIQVVASGQAVDNLGAILVWKLNGRTIEVAGHTATLTLDQLIAGVNRVEVTASIPGIWFQDKPLEASCSIAMIVPKVEAGYATVETEEPQYEPWMWGAEMILWEDDEVGYISYSGSVSAGYCWLKIPRGDGTYQTIQISDTQSPLYLGTQSATPTKLSNGAALANGCSFLYYKETPDTGWINGTPYIYDNGSWRPLVSTDGNYASIVKNSLQDALLLPSAVDIVSAYNGYFQRLAAVEAFVENLKAQNLNISTPMEGPNSTTEDPEQEDFSLDIQAGYPNTDGTAGWKQPPKFLIRSGDGALLGLATENDPNDGNKKKRFLRNESKNFMLAKDKVYLKNAVADGISAKGCNLYGNFSANIFINSGLILQPSGRSIQSNSDVQVQDARMAYDWCIWAKNNSIPFNSLLLCELSNEPSVEYCQFYSDVSLSSKGSGDWGTFDVDCMVHFYDINGTNLYTIRSYSWMRYYQVQNTWIFGWDWFGTHTESVRENQGKLYGVKTWGQIGEDGGKGLDIAPIQSVDPANYTIKASISDYGQVRDGTVSSGGVTCTGFSTSGGQSVYFEVYRGSTYSVFMPALPVTGTTGLQPGELYYDGTTVRRVQV